jgi:3'-5' exoribonuclease
MAHKFVEELADGDALDDVYLALEKQYRANRNGHLYIQLDLRDRTGAISARLWNAPEQLFRSFENGDFLLAKGKVQLFQGSLQVILNHLQRVPAEQIDLTDFLPHTPKDVNKLYDRLRVLLRSLSDPHLRALAECFLMDGDLVQAMCKVPAGVRMHHAYLGGLLEHVVTMLEVADRIAPVYPEINRDLLLMGVFLHDIGKLRELTSDRGFAYTDEGQLVGHIVLGVEMLMEQAKRVPDLTGEPVPLELLLRLRHLIVSHHGAIEFGSPTLPMTPEAIALHYLDNLDAKIHSFTREIREDRGDSAWTPFNTATQRRLFKGGRGGAAVPAAEE